MIVRGELRVHHAAFGRRSPVLEFPYLYYTMLWICRDFAESGIVDGMSKKTSWNLPIDERLIPDIFSFQYPKSPWVRALLFLEMLFAIIAVLGTLFMVLLPRSSFPATTSATPPPAATNQYSQ
jgi:hypothetical protein